jgi:hypothetical protein
MSFQNNIIEWINLDNEIKKQNNKIKELRDKRKDLEIDIYDYVDTNELNTSTIKTSDSKIAFKKVKIQAPLTLKYVESCLSQCIESEEHIKHIMKIIRNNRESKYVDEIKRTFFNKE